MFADGRPRIVNIKGIRMDAEFGPSMIYITNLDKPGFIGSFSGTLGDAGINIATFHVGREAPGGNAIALIEIDGDLPAEVLEKVKALPQVQSAKTLKFDPLPPSSPAPRSGERERVARLERSEMRPGEASGARGGPAEVWSEYARLAAIGDLMARPIVVHADWDPDANVWVATTRDLKGLVTEAETIEALRAKLPGMIHDLLEEYGISDRPASIEIVARASDTLTAAE